MRKLKKTFFTLIEMMIVLFIMAMGVAVTGVKLKEAYDEQRFLSESQQVFSTLALAQDLMLIQDADVFFTLDLNPESKKYECWIDVEKPLHTIWAKIVQRKHELPAIKSFQFGDQVAPPLHLTFSLGKMSRGSLTLFSDKETKEQTDRNTFIIHLPGYPSPLVSRTKKNSSNENEDRAVNEQLYPQEVYDAINNKNTSG